MHCNDKEVLSLPYEVKNAFDNASRIVIEADSYSAGASAFVYQYMCEWMSNNLTINYPPIVRYLVKQNEALPGGEENSLDSELINEAVRRGKQLGFLQTLEEQIKTAIGYSFDEFEQAICYGWLEDTHDLDTIRTTFEQTKKSYLANDLNATYESPLLPLNTPEVVYKYYNSLLADRDSIQAEAMKPFMEEGNVFFAVGAAHLVGITNKLKAEGYTVNLISLGRRIYPIVDCKQTLFHTPKVKEDETQVSHVNEHHQELEKHQKLELGL